MRNNRLRELLKAGKPSLGTHLHISWPGIIELVGQSGAFDYVEFEGEYAPYDLYSLENMGRAIDLFPHMSGMMKIEQSPRTYLAVRAVGSGIQNLLFADVRSVAEAEECVRAARAETPQAGGICGAGMRRDVGYVMDCGSADYVQALQDTVVVLMIEKKGAIEDLEAILSVEGIDMIQFGPLDYAMSLGLPGQTKHPAVLEAHRYATGLALKKGIAPRAEIDDETQAEAYLEMGVRHFCMGWDMETLFNWFQGHGTRMQAMLAQL